MTQRKIIHCDCDCFYASVEMRDDPSLKSLPVAVGGAPDRRGVIAACNYPARDFGVRSAMPSAYAKRLCPGLVILPPNFDKYREASRQVRQIFLAFTDLVEPLSLDEAYLDVTGSDLHHGSATLIARAIRQRVRQEVGITVSAGVAPNKFLAKVASDWNKPDGEKVILPEAVADFMRQLPVARIPGVGQVTARKLAAKGVNSCEELQAWSVTDLVEQFGRFGHQLYQLCRGVDERAVEVDQRRKSLSVEQTYSNDLPDLVTCEKQMEELVIKLRSRLRRVSDDYWVTKLFVKLKFDNFQSTTVESLGNQVEAPVFKALLGTAFARQGLPVRLLGVGVRFMDLREQRDPQQLPLFDEL